MSLWDDFVKTVQGAAGSVGSVFLKTAGQQPGATLPFAQGLVTQQAVKGGMSEETATATTQQAFNQIGILNAEQAGTQVVTPLDKYVYQPTFQALSAATLLANEDTRKPQDDNYRNALSRAWYEAKEIPFGQAFADLVASGMNKDLPDWGPLADLNQVDINIYDQELREKIYVRTYDELGNRIDSQGNIIPGGTWIENAFMGLSATADVGKQLIVDPLVWGGKGFKAARLKVLDVKRPNVIENSTEFNASQAKIAKDTATVYKEKIDVAAKETELTRVTDFRIKAESGVYNTQTIINEVDNMRAAEGYAPLPEGTDLNVYLNQYKNYERSLKISIGDSKVKIEKLNSAQAVKPELSNGIEEFVQQIVSREMTWQQIMRHKTIRDFAVDQPFLAVALEQAAKRGEGAVTDVLMLAQFSDPAALIRLRGQNADLLTIIDDAQSRLDGIEAKIQYAKNSNDPIAMERLNVEKKKVSELVVALRKDNAYLDRLLTSDNNIIGTMPGMNFSSNVSVFGKEIKISPIIEKYRADRAIVKAGLADGTIQARKVFSPDKEFRWEKVQTSPLHRATYVAQWIGHKFGREKPSGLVVTRGLDAFDGINEVRAYLDNTPVFDNLNDLKNAYMDDYAKAADEIGREAVLDRMEQDIIVKIAEHFNVANKIKKLDDGTEIGLPEFIFTQFKKERALAVQNLKADKAFAVDANNSLISNPVMSSQLEYARPMLDTNELFKFFRDNIPDPTAADRFFNSLSKTKDGYIMPAWAKIDRFWRADVLLRLGYPQRNVLSEWTVLSMYDTGLRGMFSRGTVSQASKNFALNRYDNFLEIRDNFQAGIMMAKETDASVAAAVIRSITPKRVKPADYEKYAAETIKALKEERDGYIKFYEETVADPDGAIVKDNLSSIENSETIKRFNELIAIEEQRLLDISKRIESKGVRYGTKRTIGQDSILVGPYEFAGVYEGIQGQATMSLTSSAGRLGFDVSPFNSLLKEMGLEKNGNWRAIMPTEDIYFSTLADIINKQFRGSVTANMIIRGESKEAVLAYLNSPKGKQELQSLNWQQDIMKSPSQAKKTRKAGWPLEEKIVTKGPDGKLKEKVIQKYDLDPAENYYDFLATQVIKRYLPNDTMLEVVKNKFAKDELGRGEKPVTSAELRVAAKDTDLNPIHGEDVADSALANKDMNVFAKLENLIVEKVIKNGYKWLGQYPEDAFVSHPFGAATYEAKLNEIVNTWESNNIVPTVMDRLQAQSVARKWAIQQTREFLYRAVRKNSVAASIPLLSPFFQAQLSTGRRAGKLAYRNPDKAARLIWAYNQIKTNAVEDEDGNRYITLRIPNSWYDDKGLSSQVPEAFRNGIAAQDKRRWSPSSFNLLMAGFRLGQPEVLPGTEESAQDKVARWAKAGQSIIGTGWLVQIGANEILKNNPALDANSPEIFGHPLPRRDIVEMFASPYPSQKWYDPLTSAWNKRVISIGMGSDNPLANAVFDNKVGKFIFGESNADFERTQLVIAQFIWDQQRLGRSPLLDKNPAINNEKVLAQAAEEAGAFLALRLVSNLTEAFVPGSEGPMTPYVEEYRRYQVKYGVEAYDKWLEHYPDMGYIAISRSKNLTGSSQSTDAVFLRQEHDEMIEDAIKASGLPREEALPFVQMITNKNVGEPVLRDAYAGFWQKQIGDRVTLTAEEGFENTEIRRGWAWFMNEQEAIDKRLEELGITRYSAGADGINALKRERIQQYAAENPEWYKKYITSGSSNAANGFVLAMTTALDDEKFRASLPEDSYWWNIEAILNERTEMIQSAMRQGLAAPSKAQKEVYGERIAPYLKDPSTAYYFNKFLDNDPFALVQPGRK